MAVIYNGNNLPIAYAHCIDYFSKGIDEQGPFYDVQYYIEDWNQSDAFINALRGLVSLTGGAGGQLTRTSPHQHPLSPNLFCMSARAKGNGLQGLNINGYPSYQNGAIIDAKYRPMTPYGFILTPNEQLQQIDPATPLLWCTQELDFASEAYVIPSSQVTYQAGSFSGQPVGIPFKLNVPLTYMNLTFHLVPYMPATVVRAKQGLVNISTFLGAAAGTVLFKGAKVVRDENTDGSIAQKLMMTFVERTGNNQLWNNLPDPGLNWVNVAGPGGVNLYTESDLSALLAF